MQKSRIKLLIFVAFVLLLVLLARHFGLYKLFSDTRNFAFLTNMVKEKLPLALLLYFLITVFAGVFLALPGIIYAVLAGALFGPWLGTIACCFSASAGAIISFLAARYFLKDSIKPRLLKNKYIKRYLFEQSHEKMFYVLMLTRLVPLFPFNLQNFAYGITDISLGVYSIGTFVFLLPGTAVYTVGASGITDEKNRLLFIGISLIIAVVLMLLGRLLKKRYLSDKEGENAEKA